MIPEPLSAIIDEINDRLNLRLQLSEFDSADKFQIVIDHVFARGRGDLAKRLVTFARSQNLQVGMPA